MDREHILWYHKYNKGTAEFIVCSSEWIVFRLCLPLSASFSMGKELLCMEHYAYYGIIAAAIVLFLAIILSVAIPPKHTKKVLSWIAVITVISALGLYGYGYSYLYVHQIKNNSIFVCVLRTVFDA